MADPVRAAKQLRPEAEVTTVLDALRRLWTAAEAEGPDRPLTKPENRKPSARDLELVTWELVMKSGSAPAIRT